MNKLKSIFRHSFAFFLGFLPNLITALFVALIIMDTEGFIGYLISFLLVIFGIWMWYSIYITAIKRGIFTLMSYYMASPDMDDLEIIDDPNVRRVSAIELVQNFNAKQNFFKEGYLRIWGDWQKRQLEERSMITKMDFHAENKILKIEFTNENKVTIFQPEIIFDATTYLKIRHAKKVIWEWKNQGNEFKSMEYKNTNEQIARVTNSNWKMHNLDIIRNEAALLLLN